MDPLTSLSLDPLNQTWAVFIDPVMAREKRRRILQGALAISLLLLAVIFFVSLAADWHFSTVWRYEVVGLFGASVGTAELLSRYRDAPAYALLSPPGLGYILINAAASTGALGLILAFDWKFGANGNAVAATQVLMAGFGAMALFRSSLLTVKAGSSDVGIGPSSVLSIMLSASDRSVDRLRAADRAGRVNAIMQDVSYDAAHEALPSVAIALMQNLSAADTAALTADLEGLKAKDLPPETKKLLLGLSLTNVVSTSVLAAAKKSLGASIIATAAPAPAPAQTEEPTAPGLDLEGLVGAEQEPSASEGLPATPSTPKRTSTRTSTRFPRNGDKKPSARRNGGPKDHAAETSPQ